MKIAINCSFLQPRGGGIAEYIYNLVNHLAQIDTVNEYLLYVLADQEAYCRSKLPNNIRIKPMPYGTGFWSVIKRSALSRQYWLQEEETEKFDLFHSPFFHAPKFRKAKVLLTVHDLRLYRYPSTYTLPRFLYLYSAVRNSIRRANSIITISQFTKDEILATCSTDAKKIHVVHEAINREDFTTEKIGNAQTTPEAQQLNGKHFILSVGHIEPRKNYERLILAFQELKKQPNTKNLKLVIVGKKAHGYKKVMALIDNNPDVIYMNFISRELLLWLYKNADLFVFPSYYEGFGFPPLEAACFDTISACSNVSCIPEICGDAAIYFNPYSIDEMAEALRKGLFDQKTIQRQHQNIQQNLNRFSWKKNAEETLRIYNQINSNV